jgi:hypothetical protein
VVSFPVPDFLNLLTFGAGQNCSDNVKGMLENCKMSEISKDWAEQCNKTISLPIE